MLRTTITLTAKKQLTHDVFELTYYCAEMIQESPKPGHYVMFQLAPGLNRAYSIAIIRETDFTLIIKRIPEGRGSPIICDAEIGTVFHAIIPLGHFLLRDTPRSKCFIGTGTGFAPVYCQMLASSLAKNKPSTVAFIFGVRHHEDYFYGEDIEKVGKNFEAFTYIQYYSREENLEDTSQVHQSRTGYVTDWITRENISHYEEYYLCGSPAMVKSARGKLEALGIEKNSIFWEQF
ncbi:MAG: FAD-binding oxidoreductase [Candidatus Altimarinota bacterium]